MSANSSLGISNQLRLELFALVAMHALLTSTTQSFTTDSVATTSADIARKTLNALEENNEDTEEL